MLASLFAWVTSLASKPIITAIAYIIGFCIIDGVAIWLAIKGEPYVTEALIG
jgi:hypothetical protein